MTDQHTRKPVANSATGFPRLGRRAVEILRIFHEMRVVHGYHFVKTCGMSSSTVYQTLERFMKLGIIEREYVVNGVDTTSKDRTDSRLPYRITTYGDEVLCAFDAGDVVIQSTAPRPDTIARDVIRTGLRVKDTRSFCDALLYMISTHLDELDREITEWEAKHDPACECEWLIATLHVTNRVRAHLKDLINEP